jgi:hypothetical protein
MSRGLPSRKTFYRADQWPEFKARVTACYQAPSRTMHDRA